MAAAREDITIPTFTALIHCVNAFGDHNELIRGWLLLAAQLEKIGYANPLDAITTLFILHGSSRWDKTILEQIFLAMIPKESEDIAKKYTSLEDFKRKLANCIRATLAHSSSVNEATKELATLIANEDSADRFPISFN